MADRTAIALRVGRLGIVGFSGDDAIVVGLTHPVAFATIEVKKFGVDTTEVCKQTRPHRRRDTHRASPSNGLHDEVAHRAYLVERRLGGVIERADAESRTFKQCAQAT